MDDVFINRVNHIKYFISSFFKRLNEGGLGNSGSGFSSDKEDIFLSFFHSGNVFFKRGLFFSGLGGVVSQEFSESVSVGGVFVYSEFEIFSELFVEFFEVFSVFSNFSDKFNNFFDDIFFNYFKDFVVL